MRYIRIFGTNGYYGCDFEAYWEYPDYIADESLDSFAEEAVYDHVQEFEHYADGYDPNLGWIDSEAEQKYYDNITSGWEEYPDEQTWRNHAQGNS